MNVFTRFDMRNESEQKVGHEKMIRVIINQLNIIRLEFEFLTSMTINSSDSVLSWLEVRL